MSGCLWSYWCTTSRLSAAAARPEAGAGGRVPEALRLRSFRGRTQSPLAPRPFDGFRASGSGSSPLCTAHCARCTLSRLRDGPDGGDDLALHLDVVGVGDDGVHRLVGGLQADPGPLPVELLEGRLLLALEPGRHHVAVPGVAGGL